MRRSAASSPVAAACITSAARPVTGALASDCTTTVVAAEAMKPSMCAPRSLRSQAEIMVMICCRGDCAMHKFPDSVADGMRAFLSNVWWRTRARAVIVRRARLTFWRHCPPLALWRHPLTPGRSGPRRCRAAAALSLDNMALSRACESIVRQPHMGSQGREVPGTIPVD